MLHIGPASRRFSAPKRVKLPRRGTAPAGTDTVRSHRPAHRHVRGWQNHARAAFGSAQRDLPAPVLLRALAGNGPAACPSALSTMIRRHSPRSSRNSPRRGRCHRRSNTTLAPVAVPARCDCCRVAARQGAGQSACRFRKLPTPTPAPADAASVIGHIDIRALLTALAGERRSARLWHLFFFFFFFSLAPMGVVRTAAIQMIRLPDLASIA